MIQSLISLGMEPTPSWMPYAVVLLLLGVPCVWALVIAAAETFSGPER